MAHKDMLACIAQRYGFQSYEFKELWRMVEQFMTHKVGPLYDLYIQSYFEALIEEEEEEDM